MIMDARVEAVLAEYEARAAMEAERMASGVDMRAIIEELLISVGPIVGSLMNSLIVGSGAKSILELGTCYGGSTIWLADAARATGGRVVSLDIAAHKQAYARQMLERAGLAEFVELVTGDAVASIGQLTGPFDFVLVDLWKDLYVPCLEAFYPKLAPGALIVADNMTYPPDAQAEVKKYRVAVRAKAHIESILIAAGNGIEVSRYTLGLTAPLL
jgi:predicted O-methyltransferase YrrM